MKLSRTTTVLAGAAIIALASGGVGAFAASQITSSQIKDGTIQSRDVADGAIHGADVTNGTLGLRDLNSYAVDMINQPGPQGQEGPAGPAGPAGKDGADGKDGAPGLSNLTTDGPYTNVIKGGTSDVQEAVVKCDAGQQAVGGGFSINGGADDNTPSAAAVDAIKVVGSYPYTSDYKPINDRGSFAPDEWVVKVVNTGTDDVIVRPWVTCANVAQ